jgi:stage IV sporulation protein FB
VLKFRLFDMPVTVKGSFLLIAALIGFTGVGNVAQTVAWIGIVFVSILIHELGHAFTARMYGATVAIELNGLGGLTRWSPPGGKLSPGRRALIAAAGSATGLVFGGLVWIIASQFGPYPGLLGFVLENTIRVNVFWGLLNWAPIRPLDGGHLVMSLLEKVAPRNATSIARAIFMLTAGVALVVGIRDRYVLITILAGWMLLSELSAWTQPRNVPTGLPTISYESPPDGEDEEEADAVAMDDPENPEELPR